MDNEKMFRVLEKLLDECEYFCKQNPTEYNKELEMYCKQTRSIVFDEKSNLSFDVISKEISAEMKRNLEIAIEIKNQMTDHSNRINTIIESRKSKKWWWF